MDPSNPPLAVDVIASGIHDAKNGLFDALTRIESAIQSIRADQGAAALPLLVETEQAVLASAERLSKLLSAYRLSRHEKLVALMPTHVGDLIEDVVLRISPLVKPGLTLENHCGYDGFWVCDRELVADCLINALQNALRVARHTVRIEAAETAAGLMLVVADDGPGFSDSMSATPSAERSGVGLFIAGQIAKLHERNGRQGSLSLENGSPLGGAVFRLNLP